MEPLGIQVSLIESLRFLLLNAVIIPITKKTFGRLLECDLSSLLALEALAAESRISKEEIDLSKVLKNFCHQLELHVLEFVVPEIQRN